MSLTHEIAKHFKDVHFGGNWTSVNLRDQLSGLTWQQATQKVYDLNTIAVLVFHMNYYVAAVSRVLEGEALNARDRYSFELPPILSQEDWKNLVDKTWADAERFAGLVEQFPEVRLWEDFSENKYGNYYRNIVGIIEHVHYHLGQIVLIKKILLQKEVDE